MGVPYTHTFTGAAGDPPYTFSVVGAPDGLSLNPATGELSGTPTLAGTFTPVVTVVDSISSTASVTCSITIAPQIVLASGGGAGGFRPSTCGCSPAVLAAEKLRRLFVRQRRWPYAFVFPADCTIPVNVLDTVAAPLVGATAVVAAFTVPEGFRFVLQGILQDYSGGAAFLVGDALWTVDLNTPVGIPNVQAMPVQGLTALPVPLGSVVEGSPWPLLRPYQFGPLQLIQSKVTNVALAGGVCTSGFFGYLIPDVPQ